MSADRWLVLGLGNPDREYAGTRHNIGVACVSALADDLGVRPRSHKSGAVLGDGFTSSRRVPVTLGRPGGYMNESGGPTQRAMAFYSLGLDRLCVVHDDLDLPLGAIRLKRGGGSGGHNGLKDIGARCGGPDFWRVRLGIGRPPGRQDPAAFVLRPFGSHERDDAEVMAARGADAVVVLIEDGLESAQNRFHAA